MLVRDLRDRGSLMQSRDAVPDDRRDHDPDRQHRERHAHRGRGKRDGTGSAAETHVDTPPATTDP